MEMYLETFVVSACNEGAVQACRTCIDGRRSRPLRPLLILGQTGIGKTHLTRAVAHALGPGGTSFYFGELLNVSAWRAEKFGTLGSFRARLRSAPGLLIDAVNVVIEAKSVDAEVAAAASYLLDSGRPVIANCHQIFSELPATKLKTLLASGEIVTMDPPDLALRRLLVRRHLSPEFDLDEIHAVVEYVATGWPNSLWETIGAVNRLKAEARISGCEISSAFARKVLGRFEREIGAKD